MTGGRWCTHKQLKTSAYTQVANHIRHISVWYEYVKDKTVSGLILFTAGTQIDTE